MAEAVRTLGLEAPGKLAFFTSDAEPAPEGGFRLETLYSGLSAGTELTFYKGTNPSLHSSWDPKLGVFMADEPEQAYPVERLGYMECGRVVESRNPAIEEGTVVSMPYGHKTGHTAGPGDAAVVLPEDLDPLLGIYVAHMGPICANGLLHAAADLVGRDVRALGDGVRGLNVLVTGAGVVGLLTALFAVRHGAAEVMVADSGARRLDAARALGLQAIDDREDEAWQVAKARWRHGPSDRGADVVLQCRGQVRSLVAALRALRPQGAVIDLAFYQGGSEDLRLGEEYHHNGLSLRCAQIGRVPRGLAPLWSRRRLQAETVDLMQARGADILEHLITDVVGLDEAPTVFEEIADRRREPLQVVFAMDS